jgi:hypothetical protein
LNNLNDLNYISKGERSMATGIDLSQITQHAEVLGSDNEHVGRVDHLEGEDQLKLIKNDEDSDGKHHLIPLTWVQEVSNNQVILNLTANEAKQQWQAV